MSHEQGISRPTAEDHSQDLTLLYDCHEHESYAQVIELGQGLEEELGRDPHNSHFGELECRLCHKMHGVSTLYCAQCHTVPTPSNGAWE